MSAINGKVDIAQGTANAGKVLGVNASGNVEPTTISGGEVWEEVDLSNVPTNWVAGDRIKVSFLLDAKNPTLITSWTTDISSTPTIVNSSTPVGSIIECELNTATKGKGLGVEEYDIFDPFRFLVS